MSDCSVLANPWRFLTQAETFITVLSSFGVFMSPAAAVLVVDFWLVRKQKWNIPELYVPGGICWFNYGFNWRAYLAYFLGMWPAVPVCDTSQGAFTQVIDADNLTGLCHCRLWGASRYDMDQVLPDQFLFWLHRLCISVLPVQQAFATAGSRRAGGLWRG